MVSRTSEYALSGAGGEVEGAEAVVMAAGGGTEGVTYNMKDLEQMSGEVESCGGKKEKKKKKKSSKSSK